MNISLLFLLGLMPGTSFSFNFFFFFVSQEDHLKISLTEEDYAVWAKKKKSVEKLPLPAYYWQSSKSFLVPESIRFRIFFISRGVSAFVQRQLIVYINNYILKECCIPLFFSSLFFVFVKKH